MTAFRWAALLFCVTTVIVSAQAPVPANKEPHHRTTFENSQFRILDVNVPPGETTLEHSHNLDIVTVSMTNGTDTRVQTPGQPWGATRPRRSLGHVETNDYNGKPIVHRLETTGATAYNLFAVENLKTSGWSTTPAVSAAGTTLAKESRSFRVYNVALVKDRSQASHTHAVPTLVVLLSGKVMSEGPDEKAKANAPAPVGLKQIDRPGQWVLVPAGDSHHLVRLGSEDGQILEIEVR
jgi:quercetin dioxygenase-like cupin family protein